ncbi:MAG: glutaredoxin family protein [Actinomycetota bacterium]|nr:glutaredoxin family protein [Actinomycetota bacterium]
MTPARVVVYSKPGCHLCEVAEATVEQLCDELDVGWERIDILDDPELMAAYGEQIPVTFVDGKQHDFWRVDPDRLRAALTR